MDRYVPIVVGVALLVGAVGGYAAATGAPDIGDGFSDAPPLEDPRVDRFERTASGCRGTVRSAGGTTVGPGGRFASFGVMDTASPNADLAMEITRTSPESARITTYRVDLSQHVPGGNATGSVASDCAGEVAYRLNITVDYRKTMRVAVYEDGEASACGGTDCSAVMTDERKRWWANGTA